jgi:hypothetical protein
MSQMITRVCALAVAGALVLGCASMGGPDPENFSGYLEDYSGLQPARDYNGESILREVNPQFDPNKYHALLIEKVTFYPPPQPTDKVTSDTLTAMASYMNKTLRQKLGERVRVVNQPGPGVARLNVAVCAVETEKVGIKVYQLLPVALVATLATRAVAGTPETAKLLVESEVTDSVTGERLLASVREGSTEKLAKSETGERAVTLDAVKPLINRWATGAAADAPTFIKGT